LERQKKRVLEKNDFKEAAKISNVIGEIYSSNGMFVAIIYIYLFLT